MGYLVAMDHQPCKYPVQLNGWLGNAGDGHDRLPKAGEGDMSSHRLTSSTLLFSPWHLLHMASAKE